MNKDYIYVNGNLKKHQFIYSGITFNEFYSYLQDKIRNILLIKGDYIGDKCIHNFELIEGKTEINALVNDDTLKHGDFCFVTYKVDNSVKALNPTQIAELLYLAHMFRPIKSPFSETLENDYVYLSHDDGFYCKLFCRNNDEFQNVLTQKIISSIKKDQEIPSISDEIAKELMALSEKGIFIDFSDVIRKPDQIMIHLYLIGIFTDMDKVINDRNIWKEKTKIELFFSNNRWFLNK